MSKSSTRSGKSRLFLMELIINILLFCFLCGYGLIFFTKSDSLIDDATTLQYATSLVSSVAEVYASGDGSLDYIKKTYDNASMNDSIMYLYYTNDYKPCKTADSDYYIEISRVSDSSNKINIRFCKKDSSVVYEIVATNHKVPTFSTAKEVLR